MIINKYIKSKCLSKSYRFSDVIKVTAFVKEFQKYVNDHNSVIPEHTDT